MRYLLAVIVFASAAGCASPLAPEVIGPCDIPTGPVTLRVLVMGHARNAPLAGLPAHLIAGSCIARTTTSTTGIAEWHVPAGTYTMGVRHTDYFIEKSVTAHTQWLLSIPE